MNNKSAAFIIPILLALMSVSLVMAYPAVSIITESNTYTTSTTTRTVTTDNSNPYVSGAEYTYWPNTYDYVDGYRDGYGQSRFDRYDTLYNRYNRYDTYGLDCDGRRDICFYRYTPCDGSWCRYGDTSRRQWYDDRYVVIAPYNIPHYTYAVNSQYLAERHYYW